MPLTERVEGSSAAGFDLACGTKPFFKLAEPRQCSARRNHHIAGGCWHHSGTDGRTSHSRWHSHVRGLGRNRPVELAVVGNLGQKIRLDGKHLLVSSRSSA